jgi:hypothetical protein
LFAHNALHSTFLLNPESHWIGVAGFTMTSA